jgi:hypothetical protein
MSAGCSSAMSAIAERSAAGGDARSAMAAVRPGSRSARLAAGTTSTVLMPAAPRATRSPTGASMRVPLNTVRADGRSDGGSRSRTTTSSPVTSSMRRKPRSPCLSRNSVSAASENG